jgi:hypothetical protein
MRQLIFYTEQSDKTEIRSYEFLSLAELIY